MKDRFCSVCGNQLMPSGRVAGQLVCHPESHGCGLIYERGGGVESAAQSMKHLMAASGRKMRMPRLRDMRF